MNRLDRGITGVAKEGVGFGDETRVLPVESTTSFFREPSALLTITDNLVPLFGPDVAIASVGCSSGEEVYSLLSVGMQRGALERMRVDGYDYKVDRIQRGLVGIYGAEFYYYKGYMGELVEQLIEKGALPEESSDFEMPQALKRRATFNLWDITQGPLPQQYPIALCANMLYHYVNPNWGRTPLITVLDNLANSLTPGGFLVCEGKNGYKGPFSGEYEQAFESHKAFQEREDLALPDTPSSGVPTRARVLQQVV